MGKISGTTYEWDVEESITEDGEEIDLEHYHFDTFAEAMAFSKQLPSPSRIVLVRDSYKNFGWTDNERSWAYLTNGALPEFFAEPNATGEYIPNGIRVPKRFHAEVGK